MKVFGLKIETEKEIYPPREDTDLLAKNLKNEVENGDEVLDVGTGTGILALIAARSGKNATGIDINKNAVRLARLNAKKNEITNVNFLQSDLFENVGEKRFDLIVFNPPYLPSGNTKIQVKGSEQWDGGENGREIVRNFSEEVGKCLKGKSRVLLLISSIANLQEVEKLFRKRNFEVEIMDERKIPWEKLYVLEITK